MSYSSSTLDDATPRISHYQQRRGAFQATASVQNTASIQNIVGAGALALIALTCGWTLYTNMQSARVEADFNAAAQVVRSMPGVDIAGSFEALRALQAEVPAAVRKGYASLLDPSHLLGATPGSFVKPAPVVAQQVDMTAPVQMASADPRDALPLPAAPATVVGKLAQAVPMPMSRPAGLRMPEEPNPVVRAATPPRKTSVAAAPPPEPPSIFQRLFGQPQQPGPMLAFAAPDGGVRSDGSDSASPRYDRYTAVYDIKAKTVYMPDGTRLEAHSGLGSRLDDPRFVSERMRGPTPPHLYDLTMRESLFHGVQALRLNPVGGSGAIHGRTGLLAHTYMLGPNGDSNGCVSFRNYNAFLQAYRSGQIKRLAVVASAG
jgi:hypothetical protein